MKEVEVKIIWIKRIEKMIINEIVEFREAAARMFVPQNGSS